MVGLLKIHWSCFASSENNLLIPVLVAIAMYCDEISRESRPFEMKDMEGEELYWFWCVVELLDSCETLLDSDSYRELVDDELTLFESFDAVRYWEIDWWFGLSDGVIIISGVDTGIVIILSSSYRKKELKKEGLYELEELEDCLLEQRDNTLECGWWYISRCSLGWRLRGFIWLL